MDYQNLSIKELQKLMQDHMVTSEELVIYFLNRIKDVDQGTPFYNSVRMINQNAIFEAKYADYLRSINEVKGMLHGIPVLLKDNIHTKGPLKTSAGTLAFKDYIPDEDAEVVKALKKQGAVILGKTNLTELANFMAQNMRNGYSAVGGSVLCAYDIDADPSGSSTGSAVAASLGLAPLTIGSETGGSIISPSSVNGVCGFKPTIGLVSRTGIIPISTTLDTAGPIARRVSDIAIGLDAMTSIDDEDIATCSKKEHISFFESLREEFKGMTIGIVRKNLPFDTIFNEKINDIKEALIDGGFSVVDDLSLHEPKKFVHIMFGEFKSSFESYLSQYHKNSKVHTLLDLIKFNRENQRRALKYGQFILQYTMDKGTLLEKEYIEAMTERYELQQSVKTLMKEKKLDVLIFDSYTSLGPCCGFPSMTIPLGLNKDKMPLGTYILSDHHRDKEVLQIASFLEAKIGQFISPLVK